MLEDSNHRLLRQAIKSCYALVSAIYEVIYLVQQLEYIEICEILEQEQHHRRYQCIILHR